MRLIAAAVLILGLAACGAGEDSGSDTGSNTDIPAAPPAPAPTVQPLDPAAVQTALATLPVAYAEADLENGQRVFARCRSCHTLPEGGPDAVGPNLYGLFGRPAATHGAYRYSDALKASGWIWTAETLDPWIENPRQALPGNKMTFAGIRDAEDRRDLIAYLRVAAGATA
ncbi:cytochrome c family protein [Brevundimonas sp. 2R-24]|uniref:Cytochrome c family protein n=1 Tax=Peiella sedimenti TaxID=3061083 RepID=A0ABT8SND2_9CAUL|nr:cytochrome c family protein [Caulobacteraceae bacterium XZ-24]